MDVSQEHRARSRAFNDRRHPLRAAWSTGSVKVEGPKEVE